MIRHKTGILYAQEWFIDKPEGLPNYLLFNKNRKRECCYIFRIRAGVVQDDNFSNKEFLIKELISPLKLKLLR